MLTLRQQANLEKVVLEMKPDEIKFLNEFTPEEVEYLREIAEYRWFIEFNGTAKDLKTQTKIRKLDPRPKVDNTRN
jgi:hypothetical protein